MILVAYLLVGLGIAIGRRDLESGAQDDAAGTRILLAVVVAVVALADLARGARDEFSVRSLRLKLSR